MKILIVDDSRFQQNFLLKLFKHYLPEGEVILANEGLQAFELYKKEKPDFMLTDLLMPKLNGQELVRLVKKYDEQANIVVITADIQKATQAEVLRLGALAFFNKPLTNETATALITLIKETPHA